MRGMPVSVTRPQWYGLCCCGAGGGGFVAFVIAIFINANIFWLPLFAIPAITLVMLNAGVKNVRLRDRIGGILLLLALGLAGETLALLWFLATPVTS